MRFTTSGTQISNTGNARGGAARRCLIAKSGRHPGCRQKVVRQKATDTLEGVRQVPEIIDAKV
jgi:hypothetical protein